MEFANVKAFAEMSKDLYDAMKTYALNYNLQRKGLKAFADHSEKLGFGMGGKYTTKPRRWMGNTPTFVLIL